jgi:hypothetical protein
MNTVMAMGVLRRLDSDRRRNSSRLFEDVGRENRLETEQAEEPRGLVSGARAAAETAERARVHQKLTPP